MFSRAHLAIEAALHVIDWLIETEVVFLLH